MRWRSPLLLFVLLPALAVTFDAHAEPSLAPPPAHRSATTEQLTLIGTSRDHRTPPTINDSQVTSAPLTFFVPVRIMRLDPSITRVIVHCNVSTLGSFAPGAGTTAALGETSVAVRDSGYIGTIAVGAALEPGKKAEQMRSYRCELFVESGGRRRAADDLPIETKKLATHGTL